jgi:hypothetical protein
MTRSTLGFCLATVAVSVSLFGCETNLFVDEEPQASLTGPYYTKDGDPPQGKDGEKGFDYGQWRTADPQPLGTDFAEQVRQRYLVVPTVAEARQDLEANGFGCVDGSRRVEGRAVPDLECRRDVLERRCTWHWIVEINEASGGLAPATGRYEVFCAGGTKPSA